MTVQNDENVREELGESVVLSDSVASNDENNVESGTPEIDVPESESSPTSSYVMSTNNEEFRKAAAENVERKQSSRKRQLTYSVGELTFLE